ncbi:MAG TPA: histidinol dehydrogenase [Terriglobia bacterium]|nr:histidinol dehydrogenase [Terriglobia bacterium]
MRIVDVRNGFDSSEIERLVIAADTQTSVEPIVTEIIADVRARGDAALCDYSERFDNFKLTPDTIRLTPEEIGLHASVASPEMMEVLREAIKNVREFHLQQKDESWEFYAGEGVRLGVRNNPLASVGLYVPGGKASYPSSVLMNAIPAQVAGVERIVVATPPQALEQNPLVAAALDLLGIGEIYRVGGAHAIAALAYGTESIRKVDKIVGPGNAYVQAAKRLVYGTVDIDMTAGPSEVAIVADESCDPAWIAADLLAQAEHDEMAGVWLVCWSESLAAAVFDEVQVQLTSLERKAIARVAIEKRGIIFLVENQDAAIDLVNVIAAEHVEVLMAEPDHVAGGICNAGALFIGRYAPTVVGDYFAGPSHVLPTGRTARFFSPLGVPDFMKRTSVIRYSGRAVERFGQMIEDFADAEGLTGHARSIAIRRHQA